MKPKLDTQKGTIEGTSQDFLQGLKESVEKMSPEQKAQLREHLLAKVYEKSQEPSK